VGISLEPVRQAVGRITWSLGALGLLGFALCLLGARSASRKITAPLQTLREGTLALAQGDLTHRIEIATGDEIEDLAGHFNHMADEIAARAAEARDARGALENLNASLEQEWCSAPPRSAAPNRATARWSRGRPSASPSCRGGRVVYSNPPTSA
jgi:HAMP domain-containing protein